VNAFKPACVSIQLAACSCRTGRTGNAGRHWSQACTVDTNPCPSAKTSGTHPVQWRPASPLVVYYSYSFGTGF
jgi:hypothetical protein